MPACLTFPSVLGLAHIMTGARPGDVVPTRPRTSSFPAHPPLVVTPFTYQFQPEKRKAVSSDWPAGTFTLPDWS